MTSIIYFLHTLFQFKSILKRFMRIYAIVVLLVLSSCKSSQEQYVCTPCNLACDELTFPESGNCPHCNMELVKMSDLEKEIRLVLNQVDIQEGSGVFLLEGGYKKEDKAIKIYYHKPKKFTQNSKILIVVPGAGRNADSYRNSWIEASEKYNILILSPMYLETDYDYGAYHMGNLIYNLNLESGAVYDGNSNNVFLNEEQFSFEVNMNQKEWIFNDFDRLFDLVVEELDSSQIQYDIFGHSAGGQILHRFAIFQPSSKANRIIASNSGSYTLPDFSTNLPFGVKNTVLTKENIKSSFKKSLILFIGELDNENEKGGLLLRSPSADKQGLHRLERGMYFFNESRRIADELSYEFNWKLEIVPGVGHNQENMAKAAAGLLYGSIKN